jgi:hypothetical protein
MPFVSFSCLTHLARTSSIKKISKPNTVELQSESGHPCPILALKERGELFNTVGDAHCGIFICRFYAEGVSF